MLPIGLMLLLLTGIGPLLAWRKSTLANLVAPVPVAGRSPAWSPARRSCALGVRVWARASASRSARSSSARSRRSSSAARAVRKGATGTDIFTAMIGLVGRSQRRYGGYIVHVGIVLMFLGFAGQGFKQEEQVLLKPGQQVTVGRFTVRHDALRSPATRRSR